MKEEQKEIVELIMNKLCNRDKITWLTSLNVKELYSEILNLVHATVKETWEEAEKDMEAMDKNILDLYKDIEEKDKEIKELKRTIIKELRCPQVNDMETVEEAYDFLAEKMNKIINTILKDDEK